MQLFFLEQDGTVRTISTEESGVALVDLPISQTMSLTAGTKIFLTLNPTSRDPFLSLHKLFFMQLLLSL